MPKPPEAQPPAKRKLLGEGFQVDWASRVRQLNLFGSTKITLSSSLNCQDAAVQSSRVGWFTGLRYLCLKIPVVFPIFGGSYGAAKAACFSVSRFGRSCENPVTTVTVYNPLIFVRPQSYVSPTKSVIDELPCISDLTPTKRFGDEIPVTVTWEETNPHAYTSGKIAPASETPPSAASPVEEDENYESCQENISIDTPLQEKHHLAIETLPGPDTDEDENSVESGGKRLRKKSQKIRGVYTPDARLKGLFMSEKKTEYRPLPKTSRAIFKKFSDILSENLVQFEIKTSHIVTNSFFLDIATPAHACDNANVVETSWEFSAERTDKLGRYVATELWLELGRYVATKLWLELGCHAATERNTRSVAAWRPFSSSCPMTRVSSAELFVKKNLFRISICRRRFLVFFFGDLDVNFVVTVFDPNS
ncbi:hypothetical protein DY000_02040367 [Brassica cretica]|uniref:Uncharacterized protein n=1 Tax=Brassica cretica TaxID=69181 RepID=A0ABQ7BB94_BRACR|nr:hypothetical protein DY000_02040367 [Brassica cretica]